MSALLIVGWRRSELRGQCDYAALWVWCSSTEPQHDKDISGRNRKIWGGPRSALLRARTEGYAHGRYDLITRNESSCH